MATEIGEIHEKGDLVIQWKIGNFFGLVSNVGKEYSSPLFTFADKSWLLSLYPNGEEDRGSSGYIGLYLWRKSSGPPISLEYNLELKSADGEISFQDQKCTYNFQTPKGYGFPNFFSRSELLERKNELSPCTVSVFCTLKYPQNFQRDNKGGATSCSYCKVTLDVHETVSSHLQKCEYQMKCPECGNVFPLKNCHKHQCHSMGAEGDNKGVATSCSYCKVTLDVHETVTSHLQKCEYQMKCPECGNVFPLKNCHKHQCHSMGAEATVKLVNDFKSLMLTGDHSDTVIKVKGEEFRLHRNVLASRSPYFHSMFNCSMKEKNTGVVTVDDCEPDVFRSFTYFLYTGNVDKLTFENVSDLYELADKYQEDQLKSECRHFMMNRLSIESFCDFTVLAFRHDEKEILENSISFFANKMKEIIRTARWQTLMAEYPTQANELFIKALK